MEAAEASREETLKIEPRQRENRASTPRKKTTSIQLLTDWFTQKKKDDTVIFTTICITGTDQVRSITDNIIPRQCMLTLRTE